MKKLCIVLLILFALPVFAARLHRESTYQNKWCSEMCGRQEVQLDDNTRVDCLTKTHAIEFDFANKVYEAVGQALYYSVKTKKKPGIVLILENPSQELRYVNRLRRIARKKDISCWVMYESDLNTFKLRPLRL